MKPLLSKIRAQLEPKQYKDKAVERYLTQVQEKLGSKAVVSPGGSYAKGTFIKGNHDIDVFVRFPKNTSDTVMSATLAKALTKPKVLHGSRDYFQVKKGKYVFEFVPVIHIDSYTQARNVMDMSPLHVQYIATKLDASQRAEARLAKQFCKGIGVYGAESFVRGFSGYVLELFITIYGSFEQLLRASQLWKPGVVIDPAKHYHSPQEAMRRLNEAKVLAPIILIDPVQPDRNAAAALSRESFETFKKKAAQFLREPSKQLFDTAVSKQRIKREWKGNKIIFVNAKTPKGKRDIVGSKVRICHDNAVQLFREHEFPLVHAEWRFDEVTCVCWYVLEKTTVSSTREQRGPPSTMATSVAAFRATHKNAFERSGRWYAIVPRKYTAARAVLKSAWRGMRTTIA